MSDWELDQFSVGGVFKKKPTIPWWVWVLLFLWLVTLTNQGKSNTHPNGGRCRTNCTPSRGSVNR